MPSYQCRACGLNSRQSRDGMCLCEPGRRFEYVCDASSGWKCGAFYTDASVRAGDRCPCGSRFIAAEGFGSGAVAAPALGKYSSGSDSRRKIDLVGLGHEFRARKLRGEVYLGPLLGFDILVIALKSRGTGEITAALNTLPSLRAGLPGRQITVLYGDAEDRAQNRAARDELRRIMSAPKPTSSSDEALWIWETDGVRCIPSGKLKTGKRPLMILAPHGYHDREPKFVAPLPNGSVVASWMPLGYGHVDRNGSPGGFVAVKVPDKSKMDHGALDDALGSQKKIVKDDVLVCIPPPPQPSAKAFDLATSIPPGPNEQLVQEAIKARAANPKNGLACIYGHGTRRDPTQVLQRLLAACGARGHFSNKWAIIVVMHHKADDDEDDKKLSRPKHLKAAMLATGWTWAPALSTDSGTYACAAHRVRVFHMQGLQKQWMDALFRVADLPITEGANTVQQLVGAGRPFLRVEALPLKGETFKFLGDMTPFLQTWALAGTHKAALTGLCAASLLLSGNNLGAHATTELRSLLFRKESRKHYDALAAALRHELQNMDLNPLVLLCEWLLKEELVPDDDGGGDPQFEVERQR